MEIKIKTWILAIILPFILLGAFFIIGFSIAGNSYIMLVFSNLVFVVGFPIAISILIGVMFLGSRFSKLIFVVTPILFIVLFFILSSVFLNFLGSEWYLVDCCGVCDFGSSKDWAPFGNFILGFLNFVLVMVTCIILYFVNKPNRPKGV